MYSSDLIKRNQAKTQYVDYLRGGVRESGSGGGRSDSVRLRATTAHIHLTHEERTRILDDHHHYLRHLHGHHEHHVVAPAVAAVAAVAVAAVAEPAVAEPEPVPDTHVKRRIRTRPAPASKPTLS